MPAIVILGLLALGGHAVAADLTPVEQLGKALFFDVSLSRGHNQSCATCHLPEFGWVGGDPLVNRGGAVYEASVPGRFGNRKPPAVAYATQAPPLQPDPEKPGGFVGGHFWDGRATGETLGSPAADQALGPFTNEVEQALPDVGELVRRVKAAPYAEIFLRVYGQGAFDDPGRAHANIALRPSGSSVKAYMHNGSFKSLQEVVHFYNTRDVLPVCTTPKQRPGDACWPLPEVSLNMNTEELGNLGLTVEEEAAVAAFLGTLSDGYFQPARR